MIEEFCLFSVDLELICPVFLDSKHHNDE